MLGMMLNYGKPKLEWCNPIGEKCFDPYDWIMVDCYKMSFLSDFFDIESFDGNWKKIIN